MSDVANRGTGEFSADGRVSVLYVDDDPDFADLVATFLERERGEFDVTTATGAEEGLALLVDGAFDCVVSDHQMPGRDGIEFLKAVRDEYPDLPFILFTGKGGEAVASKAISAGVTDYLRKGSGTDQYAVLANRVSNYVERARIERERERQLDAIETAQEGISILDEDGHFVYVNGAYADLYGYEPEELVGEHWEVVCPDDTFPEIQERILPAVEETGRWRGTTTGLRADGTTFVGDHTLAATDRGELVCAVRDVTDRVRRKQELERERDRYATLFEHLPNPVVHSRLVDGKPVVEEVNPAFEETFGYGADAVVGERLDELVVPDDRRDEVEEIVAQLHEEGAVRMGVERRTADGPRDFVLDAVVRDGEADEREGDDRDANDGGEGEGYAIYTEITERTERERELEKATERMRLALEGSNSWVWDLDLETGMTTQSAVTGLLGVDDEQVTRPAEDFLAQVHPDDRGAIAVNDEGVREGEPYHAEFRLVDGDEVRWIESHGRPYPNDSDDPDRVIGIARDVTDRKEREQELQAAQYVLDSAPDGINIADLDGEIQRVNPAFLEMWGYESEAAVVGERVTDKWADTETAERARRAMEETGSWSGELLAERSDGTTFPVQSKMSVVTDDDGDPVARMGIFRDITEQRERERELERQNERLEAFASIVSHDLRNPLNVAQGRLEIVDEECDSDQVAPIKRAHDRMEALIDDLLTLAMQGDRVSDVEPVALADAAEACWHNIATGDATLVVETDRTVRADRSRLRQLLENLVNNAVEHGGDDVTVTVSDLEDGFYVEDDGPGIPAEERDQVFDAGYSTADDGTGFGLAIVQQVADAHGWTIDLTGGNAGGARFEIRTGQSR